ncbi:MAG: hypothetical protein AAF734_05090, partial [Bacteroidota bacterium]
MFSKKQEESAVKSGIIFANEESEAQYNRLYNAVNEETKAQLDALTKSDQIYNIHVGRDLKDQNEEALLGGETRYNFKDNQIDLLINPTDHEDDVFAILGDELTHAYQFEKGDIAFTEMDGYLVVVGYDIQDEFDSKLGSF